MPGLITAWSFSRWAVYEECPKKAKFKFVDKLAEPGSPAMDRGTALHNLCEDYLRGVKKVVPKELKLIGNRLKELKKAEAIPEGEFAFDAGWRPVSWFDRAAWCRVKADATIPPVVDADEPTVEVVDFKSGGKLQGDEMVFKEEYPLQLELYCLSGLLSYPTAKKAKASLLFIDHGKEVQAESELTLADLPKLKKAWETRTKKMLSDTKFKPKPGNACRWCHYSRSKRGPCEF